MCICKNILCCFKKKNKTKKKMLSKTDCADTKYTENNSIFLDIDIHTKTTVDIRQTSSFYDSSRDDIINLFGEIGQDN